MKWGKKINLKKSEAKAMGLILVWVVLYFEIHRFVLIQAIGKGVPLAFKLICFSLFLAAAMFTVNGIYKGMLVGKPKMLSPVWFVVDVLLSIAFAIVSADQLVLFRVLSLLIFVFDRSLYYLVYRKKFSKVKGVMNSD